jgi:hypothetical protein
MKDAPTKMALVRAIVPQKKKHKFRRCFARRDLPFTPQTVHCAHRRKNQVKLALLGPTQGAANFHQVEHIPLGIAIV